MVRGCTPPPPPLLDGTFYQKKKAKFHHFKAAVLFPEAFVVWGCIPPLTFSTISRSTYVSTWKLYNLKLTYVLSPVHMRWFTHGMQIIHICIFCTQVYFWACERNCIYVKVNLHMCKYTPPCKYTPAQTRCIFAFTYMYFLLKCIFGHVNAQQIYTRMQMYIFLLFQVKLEVKIKYFCV